MSDPVDPQPGSAVHDQLAGLAGLAPLARHDEAGFRLDVYTRAGVPAVFALLVGAAIMVVALRARAVDTERAAPPDPGGLASPRSGRLPPAQPFGGTPAGTWLDRPGDRAGQYGSFPAKHAVQT